MKHLSSPHKTEWLQNPYTAKLRKAAINDAMSAFAELKAVCAASNDPQVRHKYAAWVFANGLADFFKPNEDEDTEDDDAGTD